MGGAMSQKETTHNPSVEQLQKLHRRRMTIFGSIILIAGIAIGSASTIILMPHDERASEGFDPVRFSKMMTDRLRRILDLTAEQEAEIREISRTAFEIIYNEQKKAKPIIEAAIKKMNEDISKILTEEQNARWQRDIEEFKRRFRERWHRGGRRPGEGGPGPGFRRGPGDPNRDRRGPGGWHPDDPNRPRRGPGPYGPDFGPGDPNRPRGDFDRDAMRERYRRGDGSFDRRPQPDDKDRPPAETPAEGETEGE